jgi:hypothetical protein
LQRNYRLTGENHTFANVSIKYGEKGETIRGSSDNNIAFAEVIPTNLKDELPNSGSKLFRSIQHAKANDRAT